MSRTVTPKTETAPYDVAELQRTLEEMTAYLDAWLTDAPEDAAGIAGVKGITLVVRDRGLSRESHYKALGENGNPSRATVLKVAKALGLRLHSLFMKNRIDEIPLILKSIKFRFNDA
jgi:probable addiction module antidote protein